MSSKLNVRKVVIVLGCFLVLAFVGYIYVFQIVPEKEKELNRRGFRILSRIEKNIHDKKLNVLNTVDRVYSKRIDCTKVRKPEGCKEVSGLGPSYFEGLDSVRVIDRKELRDEYGNSQFFPVYNKYDNKWFIHFFGDIYYLSMGNFRLNSSKIMVYSYEGDLFFNDILNYRDDFFHDYLVLQNDTVIYQSKPLVHKSKNTAAIELILKDRFQKKILFTDYVQKDTLNGEEYYLFFHPFNDASDIQFTLCGLVPASEYRKSKYILEVDQVVWGSLLLLVAVFSLPFIKVFSVSRFERIFHTDVILIGFALMAGGSILTISVLLKAHAVAEQNRQKEIVKAVSRDIKGRVWNEVQNILLEIGRHEKNLAKFQFENWILKNKRLPYTFNSPEVQGCFNGLEAFHFTENLLLIHSKGYNWASWLKEGRLHPDMDLSRRDYVNAISGTKPSPYYATVSDPTSGEARRYRFYLQPIYSWQNQENTVVVSVETEGPVRDVFGAQILALETQLFSVMKSAMPDEIDFLILNADGEVLFHSDGKRNLRENFIEESDKEWLTREVITERIDTTMDVRYYGRERLARFLPFQDLPFTIVTMYDKTAYKSSIANQVTFIVLLLALLGLLISAILVATYFATRRPTLLKRQKMNLNWLRVNPLNEGTFRTLNVALLIPTAISFFFINSSGLLFMSFLLPILTLGICGAIIYSNNESRYKTTLYTLYIVFQYRVFFLLCLIPAAMLFALLIYADSHFFSSAKFWVGTLIILFLALLAIDPTLAGSVGRDKKALPSNSLRDYPVASKLKWNFAISSLILLIYNLSVFPTLNFLSLAAREERDLTSRRNSFQIAASMEKRLQWIEQKAPSYFSNLKDDKKHELLSRGVYSFVQDADLIDIKSRPEMNEMIADNKRKIRDYRGDANSIQKLYKAMVSIPKIRWNEYDIKANLNHNLVSSDSVALWWWDKDKKVLHYKVKEHNIAPSEAIAGISIHVSSFENGWRLLSGLEGFILIFFVVLLVFLCYRLLSFIYKKVMLTEYFVRESLARSRLADKDYIEDNITKVKSNLLIVSVPGSGITKFLLSKVTELGYSSNKVPQQELEEQGIEYIYFERVPNTMLANDNLLILPYFDLKASNVDTCKEQVAVLATYLQNPKVKVIWIASTDPCEQVSIIGKKYIELYKTAIKNKNATAGDYNDIRNQMDQILHLVDDFVKVHFPLEENRDFVFFDGEFDIPFKLVNKASGRFKQKPLQNPLKYVDDEFRYGDYFRSLRDTVMGGNILKVFFKEEKGRWCTQCDQAEEFFILKVQDMSQNYYHSIWASLTSKEKYVLYDLAQDDLTNYKNFSILSELERKGILFIDRDDNALKIFNKSFQNFVLTVVDPDEALILEKEINVRGTWEIVSTILVILLVAIAAFMFLTEQAFFNKVVLLATAVTTLLPTLIKILTPLRMVKESGS